ncbi:MAG TPA: hypothetical protein VEY71_11535 [Chitinophagales bacterium]|nr:hypothetical protein [Chitinophagales bacterium]
MKNLSALLFASIFTIAACNNAPDKPAEQQDATPETPNERPSISNNDADLPDGAHKHGDNVVGVMGSGPHKGFAIHGSNGYHIEMTIDGKDVAFYPLDPNASRMDMNGWSGSATVQQGGNTKTINLESRDGKLIAQNINTAEPFKAVVTLKKGDQTTSATFDSASASSHDHADGEHDHGDGKLHTH